MSGTGTINRRKWNSVDQLAGSVEELSQNMTEKLSRPSNLSSMQSLSKSTPMIFDTSVTNIDDAESDLPKSETPEESPRDKDHGLPLAEDEFLLLPTKNKARQKKYSRHFKKDDDVLEYYSCALAVDILLQGYLYITKNYFAFYSNVFGRVTKTIIPVVTINKVAKSNTALIFPNAIHVHTESEKHVFASFISRDTAYTLMNKVLICKRNIIDSKKQSDSVPEIKVDQYDELETAKDEKKRKERRRTRRDIERRVESTDSEPENNYVVKERAQVAETFSKIVKKESLGNIPHFENEYQGADTTTAAAPSLHNSHSSLISPESEAPVTFNNSGWTKVNRKQDKYLLRLCFVLIIFLTISAVHLYFRIDAVLQKVPEVAAVITPDEEALMHEQSVLYARSAYDILERINQNIKNINAMHDILEQFSQQSQERIGGTHSI